MKNKVAVVIVYFGNFPDYMAYFLKSASYNTQANFLIFTDADYSPYAAHENIIFHRFSLAEFNRLANEKISGNTIVAINNGYKLCDLKPMYGCIMQDYITDYFVWAHSDVDLFIGDFKNTFNVLFADQADIVSSHPNYISGAFTAYRNIPHVNNLFKRSKDYARVLTDSRILLFDEASDVIAKLWDGHGIFDFPSEIESMTHLVQRPENNIRVLFAPMIKERLRGKLLFEEGRMHDEQGDVQLFHFLTYKNNIIFNVPPYQGYTRWVFAEQGIFTSHLSSRTVSLASSVFRNFSKKVTRKLKQILN